jgi:cytochrome oxidase Cu insertion factor (SCO1/SenC/PrrC family)
MRTLSKGRLLVIAAIVLGIVGVMASWLQMSPSGGPSPAIPIVGPGDRVMAPDFELKDLDGKSVRLSDYRGKTALVVFWASW